MIIFWIFAMIGFIILYLISGFVISFLRIKWALKYSNDYNYEYYRRGKCSIKEAIKKDTFREFAFWIWPIFSICALIYLVADGLVKFYEKIYKLQLHIISSSIVDNKKVKPLE